MRIRFAFSSSTGWANTPDFPSAMFASLARSAVHVFLALPQCLQRALELETILEQRQIHVERLGSNRLDLGDDGRQRSTCQCACNRLLEPVGRVGLCDLWNSAGPRHIGQVSPVAVAVGK